MAHQFKVYVGSIVAVMTVVLAVQANATPVNLTGAYSDSLGSIAGTMQGDYSSNTLTLNPAPYSNTLTVDLASQPLPALPAPIWSKHGAYCGGYQCTIRGYANESYSLGFTPWNFDIAGNVQFDDAALLGGTANLTVTPIPVAQIASFTGTATPYFTVTADQGYGLVNQALADSAAALVQSGLNAGNWHGSVDGTGIWDSVDAGTTHLSRSESAGLTTLDISLQGMTLNGSLSYNSDLTFSNSVLNYISASLISDFRGSIDNELTGLMLSSLGNFNSLGDGTPFSLSCSGDQTGNSTADVSCNVDAAYEGSFRISSTASVPEPATAGLFGLGLAGLIFLRRRRT